MLPWIWVFDWGCTTSVSDLGPWSPWTFLTLGSRDVCLGGCGMAFQGLGERYEPRRLGRAEDGEVWGYICHEGMKLVEWQVFFWRCFNTRIWNPSGEGGSLAVLQPAKAWKGHCDMNRLQGTSVSEPFMKLSWNWCCQRNWPCDILWQLQQAVSDRNCEG